VFRLLRSEAFHTALALRLFELIWVREDLLLELCEIDV
jgi:hypothetical protein